MSQEKKQLSSEQKKKIYNEIYHNIMPDDRIPQDVIESDYDNDEEKYLRVMAKWHNVNLD